MNEQAWELDRIIRISYELMNVDDNWWADVNMS